MASRTAIMEEDRRELIPCSGRDRDVIAESTRRRAGGKAKRRKMRRGRTRRRMRVRMTKRSSSSHQ